MTKILRLCFALLTGTVLFSGCHKELDGHLIEWEGNQLSYFTSSDHATVGEVVFIHFRSDCRPGVRFEITAVGGDPIENILFDFKFLDLDKNEAAGEVIWLDSGEMIVENLAVSFYGPETASGFIDLEPLHIEVSSNLTASPSGKQGEFSIQQLAGALEGPLDFILNSSLKVILPVTTAICCLLAVVAVLLFLLQRRRQQELNRTALFRRADRFLDQYRKTPSDFTAQTELYNLLILSRAVLKKNRKKLNQSYYSELSTLLESQLFSREQKQPGQIELNRFVSAFEAWIRQLENLDKEDRDV